jgi:hypothetical protein
MRRLVWTVGCLLLTLTGGAPAETDVRPEFEVSSIRLNNSGRPRNYTLFAQRPVYGHERHTSRYHRERREQDQAHSDARRSGLDRLRQI